MSVIQMTKVFQHSQAKGSARLVLLALADVASDDGEVTAYARSYKILAIKANVEGGTVRKAIAALVDLGEIVVLSKGDGRKPADYLITVLNRDPEPEPAPEHDPIPEPEGGPEAPPGWSKDTPRVVQIDTLGGPEAHPINPSLFVSTPSESPSRDEALFDEFWSTYPRRTAKPTARKAFAAALTRAPVETIMDATRAFAAARARSDPKFTPHPATWLNADRWADDPEPVRNGPRQVGARATFDESERDQPEGRIYL